MLLSGVAPVIRAVKHASSTEVCVPRIKSSADSISNFPALSGRVAVAINPSGPPVLKKVVSAAAGAAQRQPRSDSGIANRASVFDIVLHSPQRGLVSRG